jgi:hypothetical protein
MFSSRHTATRAFARASAALLFAIATAGLTGLATPALGSSYVESGSDNPVSAQPPVTRPPTKHCTVTLAHQFPSNAADGTPQQFSGTFTPPADCKGPWAKVVLDFTSSVSGRQYDRSASISVGGTTIWFGTTQEPGGDTPTVAHMSKDVTRYEALFTHPQAFSGGIGNYTSSVYTGVFVQDATLTFYEADAQHPAPPEPDGVVGLSVPDLTPSANSAEVALPTLPRNLTRADLEVTLKGNGCDEQWFTAVPDAVNSAFGDGLCGAGPYREADFSLDGTPAGAVGTYPHIYSGGIVPALWRPVLAIDTRDLRPENLDLTPFVGRLVDGGEHKLGVRIPQINDRWNVVGTLFLWTDHHRAQTSGALTRNQVQTEPTLADTHHPTGTGDQQDYTVTGKRHDVIAGYVDTSRGRIYTTDTYDRSFSQTGSVANGGWTQSIDQSDHVRQSSVSTLGTTNPGARVVRRWNLEETYPISVDFTGSYTDGQNYQLEATVDMGQQVAEQTTGLPNQQWDWTVDSYGIQARSAGAITALDGHSTTRYDGTDDLGTVHHNRIETEHGRVTSSTWG